MDITDLTLRSDRSFGTFQLLSLFFQDWIGFSITRQSTLSAQAVTESLCTDSPVAHSPGLSFGSASASEADSTIAQNSSSLLRATHTTGAPLMFSPNTAQLFSECTGNTPQFASFAHGTSFLEDQRTAISTPIASLWKRKEGPTTGATCESAHSNTHCWDSSTVPVSPVDCAHGQYPSDCLYVLFVRLCQPRLLYQTFSRLLALQSQRTDPRLWIILRISKTTSLLYDFFRYFQSVYSYISEQMRTLFQEQTRSLLHTVSLTDHYRLIKPFLVKHLREGFSFFGSEKVQVEVQWFEEETSP